MGRNIRTCNWKPIVSLEPFRTAAIFGYTGDLNRETASEVWELCNRKLQEEDMRVRSLIKTSGVTLLCTTDDPVDDLRWHKMIKDDPEFDVQVLPAGDRIK